MKTTIRINRLVAAGVAIGAALLAHAPMAAAAPAVPTVPSELAVPDGNKLFRVGHAIGVQIYSCTVTTSGAAWALVAPRADLYDDRGRLIITHFAGPTWQAKDGSAVKGKREANVTVDPSAIDWLKLSAASTQAGPDGDLLLHTSFIQRLATSGGLPPAAADCTVDTAGARAEVPYTADYYFWRSANE